MCHVTSMGRGRPSGHHKARFCHWLHGRGRRSGNTEAGVAQRDTGHRRYQDNTGRCVEPTLPLHCPQGPWPPASAGVGQGRRPQESGPSHHKGPPSPSPAPRHRHQPRDSKEPFRQVSRASGVWGGVEMQSGALRSAHAHPRYCNSWSSVRGWGD